MNTGVKKTVSFKLAALLLKYARDLGHDADPICIDAGLDTSMLTESNSRIDAHLFGAVWDRVEKLSGNDNFGLDFGIDNYLWRRLINRLAPIDASRIC